MTRNHVVSINEGQIYLYAGRGLQGQKLEAKSCLRLFLLLLFKSKDQALIALDRFTHVLLLGLFKTLIKGIDVDVDVCRSSDTGWGWRRHRRPHTDGLANQLCGLQHCTFDAIEGIHVVNMMHTCIAMVSTLSATMG
jgi:hypothetical protein